MLPSLYYHDQFQIMNSSKKEKRRDVETQQKLEIHIRKLTRMHVRKNVMQRKNALIFGIGNQIKNASCIALVMASQNRMLENGSRKKKVYHMMKFEVF